MNLFKIYFFDEFLIWWLNNILLNNVDTLGIDKMLNKMVHYVLHIIDIIYGSTAAGPWYLGHPTYAAIKTVIIILCL